ncbi:MAG: ribosome hibernation-promoting factor, HPF/YfiA family [Acidimicrobiales bacterium]
MDISIRARNVEVSESFRRTVEEKVANVGRFLDGMDHAEVRFLEERNPRIADKEVCEVTLHGHGHVVRARATAPDPTTAVDRVVDKLEHRLHTLKGKLIGRSHPRRPATPAQPAQPAQPALNGVVAVEAVLGIDLDTDLDTGADVDEDGAGEGGRRIVRTKQFAIKPMTPEEGALQMELLGHSFFLFTNADTGGAAVVYRRHDGDVGLIEGA